MLRNDCVKVAGLGWVRDDAYLLTKVGATYCRSCRTWTYSYGVCNCNDRKPAECQLPMYAEVEF